MGNVQGMISDRNRSVIWNAEAVGEGLKAITLCRQDLLGHVKDLLDGYHGETRSRAYYDLLVGNWLELFAHQTYVAWREALQGNIPADRHQITVAADPASYQHRSLFEGGKPAQLLWEIACLLEGASPDDWDFECEEVLIESVGNKRSFSRLLKWISPSRPDVLVTMPYFKCPKLEWLGALWRWRRWLKWDDLDCHAIRVNAIVDTEWRRTQAAAETQTLSLSGLLRALLPLHLPVVFLEGFAGYRRAVMDLPVARPKVVYSANALYNNMIFKFLVAEWRQKGTKLLYHQHGGGYGIDRIHAYEDFEIRVSDRYYTWGWRREESHVEPLGTPLPYAPRRIRKWLLLCCNEYPRVVYRLQYYPLPGRVNVLYQQTCEFLAALPDRNNVLVRPYPHDYGWGGPEMMQEAAPEAAFDDCQVSPFVRFAESRLVVFNHLGTGWLETLALNIPTVCFFDPDAYAFRESAQPYVDALEQVGILHRSGIEAASFVAWLGGSPERWWNEPNVQEIRKNFVDNFANFSCDWKNQWENEFEAVLDGSR